MRTPIGQGPDVVERTSSSEAESGEGQESGGHVFRHEEGRGDGHEHQHQHEDGHGHEDGHAHGHSHGLTQSDQLAGVSDRRLLWCVGLNHLLTVGQVIGGLLSGSVALLSDAAHNFNDANALLIAYVARRISRRDPSARYTFGYRRAELIGATINLTLLGGIGALLVYEAIHRFFVPTEVLGWLMAAAAVLALVIDVATAALLWSMSHGSLNVRAAFVHNLTDALGSLAVLIGAVAIIFWQWTWVDPLLTLLIAVYVLWQVVTMLPQAVQILMEGAPSGIDLEDVIGRACSVDGVRGIHHVHLWQLDESHRALEAHVVIDEDESQSMETVKRRIKAIFRSEFEIHHSTLEFEFDGACHDQLDPGTVSNRCGSPTANGVKSSG